MLGGTVTGALIVPAGPVEHEHGMRVGRDGCGEVGQEAVHGAGRDPRQDQAEILAGGGPYGGKNVGGGEAPVAQARRTLAPHPPPVTCSPFLADTGFPRVKPEGSL